MSRTISGKAAIAPTEPNLYTAFEMDRFGNISVHIGITPDHTSQQHDCDDGGWQIDD